MDVLSGGRSIFYRSKVRFLGVWQTTIRSALVGEPGKVRKYGRDQIAMMGVGRSQSRGV
jgi:hypothetical protein